MSREKLEGVVRALNEKLPQRMRIGAAAERGDQSVSDEDEDIESAIAGMSDAEIRRRIEVLVGIRRREGAELGDLSVSLPAVAPTLEVLGTCAKAEVPVLFKSVDTPDHERCRAEDAEPARELDVDENHAEVELSSPEDVRAITSSPPRARGHTLPPLSALQEEQEAEEQDGTRVDDQRVKADEEAKNTETEEAMHAVECRSSSGSETDRPAFISTWTAPFGRLPTAQGSRLLENFEVSVSPLLDFDDDDNCITAAVKVASTPARAAANPALGLSRLRRRWSAQTRRKPEHTAENSDVLGRQAPFSLPPSGARKVKARPLSFPAGTSWSVWSNKDRPLDMGERDGGGEADKARKYDDGSHHSGNETTDSKPRSSVLQVHPVGATVTLSSGVDINIHKSDGGIGTGQAKLERSRSERHSSRVSTNRLRKRFSWRRSSWAASGSRQDLAGPDYGSGVTLTSESDSTTGGALKSGLGFDVVELEDSPPLPVAVMDLHAKMGNALGFGSSLSSLGPRSERGRAMSISTVTSVRDARDVGELSGNVCAAELDDPEGDVPPSPMIFASRVSGLVEMEVDLDQDIAKGLWMALDKIEVADVEDVETGVKV